MRSIASLSLEQAPPYHIPLRFFVTAPILAMVAALVLMFIGPAAFASRWTPALLAVTHLLTLGYMSMVMLGAMLQMLPVLAGVPVRRVVLTGSLVHLLIVLGCLLLAVGFLWHEPGILLAAAGVLAAGFVLFISATGFALHTAGKGNPTIRGMVFALVGLLAALGLGLLVVGGFTGWLLLPGILTWTDVHLSWGVVGWFGGLLIAVSYQVVPMFQVTPEYPRWMQRWLSPVLLVTLLSWSVISLAAVSPIVGELFLLLLLLELGVFALTTLWLLSKRKRKVRDNTLLFWRTGIGFFLLVGVMLIVGKYKPQLQLDLPLGVLVVQGVILTMINGMLYRIVPFLSWFHLQHAIVAEGRFDIKLPHMKLFISDQAARRQYYVHLAAVLCMVAASVSPEALIYPAAALLFISNLLLLMNLGQSWHKHSAIKKNILSAA
jgi:hypothetical protein